MKLFNLIKFSIIVCFFLFLSSESIFAQRVNFSYQDEYYKIRFPAGVFFKGILQHSLSTVYGTVGDRVDLIIPSDTIIEEVNCVPKGSKIIGRIIKLEKPKAGRNAYIQIVFHTLRMPSGQNIDILGHVWTSQNDGILGGKVTPRIGLRKVPHYVQDIGAYNQLKPYGPRKIGKELHIKAGTEWIVTLDKDLLLFIPIDDY